MKYFYKSILACLVMGIAILSSGEVFAQPANDTLCNAAPLVVGAACTAANGDNTGATAEVNEPAGSCFFGGNASVWYSFTGPATGYVDITTDIDSSFVTNDDTEIALYALPGGNCNVLTDLVEIDCSQDDGVAVGFGFNSIITGAPVTTGQTYYIQVSGYGTTPTTGAFCIEVAEAPAPPAGPANDTLCNAQLLTVGATCITPNGDNTSSTAEVGEPNASCFFGGVASVWFKFEAPASGFVSLTTDIDVAGVTNDDTEMALYALPGGNCTALSDLVEIACDQDGGTVVGFGFNSIIPVASVTAGDTLYVQISGYGTTPTEGAFCLEVAEVIPPANDSLCDAEALTLGGACLNGDLENSSLEAGEGSGNCSFNNNSVWYSFVAPASGFVNIGTDTVGGGTNTDTDIAVYALLGGNCADLTGLFEVACQTGTGGVATLDTLLVSPGLTYYVQVSGGTGTFCIEAEAVTPANPPVFPANDSLCNAISITVDAACTSPIGDNTGASAQIGEPFPGCFSGGVNSIWYTFVGPASGLITISTDIDSSFITNTDTEIALYELPSGNCANPQDLVEVACDQDGGTVVGAATFSTYMSIIGLQTVTPGTTYYIQVSGWNGSEGAFCMEIEQFFIPTNDDACDADTLMVDGSITTAFNIGATVETNEDLIHPPVSGANDFTGWTDSVINNSVWYAFTAPASGAVAIDLCNGGTTTDFDTKVAVYDVDDCADFSTFTFLGGNDDLIGCATASYLEVGCLTPDSVYYIVVDGWEGDVGNFGISIIDTMIMTTTSVVGVNPTCTGDTDGSATVTALNGGPFTYLWSTGATTETVTGLAAGTYTVEVFNACGDTLVDSVLLADPAVLTLSFVATPPSCVGGTDGSIDLVLDGGSGPFTYTWSTGDTIQDLDGLMAGTYAVGVTDACGQAASLPGAVLPEGTPVAVDAGVDTMVCAGVDVMLGGMITASGGVPITINRLYAIESFFENYLGITVEDVTAIDTIGAGTMTAFTPAGDFGGDGVFYGVDADANGLVSIDTITGVATAIGPLGQDPVDGFTGIAWNAADNMMYGIAVAGTDSSSLYTIDLTTGAATKVTTLSGSTGTLPIWLAIDTAGMVYAMDIVGEVLQSIDPVAGTITTVGPTGLSTNFAQDADFDPVTNILYTGAFDGVSFFTEMHTIDVTTGAATYIGNITGFAEITAIGISPVTVEPYQYTWVPGTGIDDATAANPMATVTETTDYIVNVLDACGVLIADTITVSVPDSLSAVANGIQDNGGNSGSAWVDASGGMGAYAVLWSTGATTDTISELAFGTYTVTVTDECGVADTSSFVVSDNTALENLLAAGVNVFKAFPNPSSGVFTLQVELAGLDDLNIALYDMAGKALYQDNRNRITNYDEVIDVSKEAAAGVYVLEIRTSKGVAHKRINIH